MVLNYNEELYNHLDSTFRTQNYSDYSVFEEKIEELQDNVRLLLVDKYKVESDNAGNKIYRIIDNYNNQYEINANIDDMLVYSMKIFEKE